MPIFGNPKKNRNSSTSNGMFLMVSTYAVPAARRGATGLTRIDAMTRPMASATAKLSRVSSRVRRNPEPKAPAWSTSTFNYFKVEVTVEEGATVEVTVDATVEVGAAGTEVYRSTAGGVGAVT